MLLEDVLDVDDINLLAVLGLANDLLELAVAALTDAVGRFEIVRDVDELKLGL
jgi:hypothetical protein